LKIRLECKEPLFNLRNAILNLLNALMELSQITDSNISEKLSPNSKEFAWILYLFFLKKKKKKKKVFLIIIIINFFLLIKNKSFFY
jgi:hypothetical protein